MPIGTPMTSAADSYERSSTSTRITAERNGSARSSSASRSAGARSSRGVDVVISLLAGCGVHRAGGDRVLLAVLEIDRRPLPLARAQEHVATDREEPAAAVGAGDESMPGPVGAEKGLLHHVVGVRLLAREREREAIDVVEPRERVPLEGGVSCDIAGGAGFLRPGVSRHARLLDRAVERAAHDRRSGSHRAPISLHFNYTLTEAFRQVGALVRPGYVWSMRARLIAAFAAVYVIWGSTYLAIRFAVETLPPLLMAGARFVLAGLDRARCGRACVTAPRGRIAVEWRIARRSAARCCCWAAMAP